ncbi:MAG: hypothetical protein BWY70_01981 [Bacteroidetes bacterium ADurb.Bin408]|nr:MAG: hypothetical protein BWY70_01981 [Bacteroidetes bacterium ADurb.Bin408]
MSSLVISATLNSFISDKDSFMPSIPVDLNNPIFIILFSAEAETVELRLTERKKTSTNKNLFILIINTSSSAKTVNPTV